MPRFATLDIDTTKISAELKVVGVGGGGCNAIDSMINRGLTGVEYVAINTDNQALLNSKAQHKIQIGKNKTRGLGAGADPNTGREAAEEDREKITKILEGSDMVFVTAGMGGGTGTGAAPLVASIAKSLDALVIGIVTKPFRWEGKKRMMNAENGINELQRYVDSLIVIPNERLLSIIDNQMSANQAFDKPNEVLYEATRGIADIITINGIINVDFADVRSVMRGSGKAIMGCGTASGENRAVKAAHDAISSPLLEGISIKGAKNILLNVSGSNNLTMQEIDEGNRVIYEAAGEEANVIFGWVNKEDMNENVSYTVIATGFEADQKNGFNGLSTVKEEKKTKREDTELPATGFMPKDLIIEEKIEDISEEDLNVPTIVRVKGSSRKILDDFNFPSVGYKVEEKPESETKKETVQENLFSEQSSSNFLRKMMD